MEGQGVVFPSGIYMKLSGGTMILSGNWVNNGNYSDQNGTIIINGITNLSGYSANTFGNVKVLAGAKLSISPHNSVSVNGTLTNNAGASGFVLESDSTGTASLIHNTNNVLATIQRYINGASEAWHFLSSPVAGQGISGSWLPSGSYSNGTGYDLYLYNEPNSCWIYKLDLTSTINWNTVHPGSDFAVGRGYLYSLQAASPTKEFTGNLNNGSLNFGLTFNGTDITLKGFNLVGNPYPSSIDWSAASGWTRTVLNSSGGGYDMWIWNPAANNYGVYNSADADGLGTNSVTRYIAPMQGYFVQASGNGNLGMNNNIRTGFGAVKWFKGKGEEINKEIEVSKISLWVKSDEGYGTDEVLLKFGFSENKNGAMKLFSRALSAPGLYMASEGKNLSVRYLTDAKENKAVPLLFSPGADGKYSISCSFDQNKYDTVMLEDRQMHHIVDMKEVNTYSFTASKNDNPCRFVLHFGKVDSNSEKEFPVRIYTDGIRLIVDLTQVNIESDALVYDMMGRLLLQQKLQGNMQHSLDINTKTKTQFLIVYLKNPNGIIRRKILWNMK